MSNAIYKAYKHLESTNFMGFRDRKKQRAKAHKKRFTKDQSSTKDQYSTKKS